MNAARLYAECQRRSIRLWIGAAGTLEVAAPRGVLTPRLTSVLATAKEALLAHLRTVPAPSPGLFADAELLPLVLAWEDRHWCESRIGEESVILVADSDRPFGFTAPDATGEYRLTVYRVAEVAALRERGIVSDGPRLQAYHRYKQMLLAEMDPAQEYALTGRVASPGSPNTWKRLVGRAGVVEVADALLEVLTKGGILYRGERFTLGERCQFVAGHRSFTWVPEGGREALSLSDADDPFAESEADRQ